MKKLLLAGIGLMLAAVPLAAFSAEYNDPASQYTLEQQILVPDADGNFNGQGTITRLEFTLTMVSRFYGSDNGDACLNSIASSQPADYTNLFSDVGRDEWFAPRLCIAMRAGLIQGNADGSFRAFSPITAAEASKVVARAYGLPSTEEVGAPWYQGSLQTMRDQGAITESVVPGQALKRFVAAQMFYALRDVLAFSPMQTTGEGNTNPPMMTEPQMPTEAPRIQIPLTTHTPAETTVAPTDVSGGCAISRANSPGTALLVLGIEAHPRSVPRHSPRALEEQARTAYKNATLQGPNGGKPQTNVLTRCANAFLRSPAGGLQPGTFVPKVLTSGKIPNRFIRAEAEKRGEVNDFRINRNVGY